MTSYECCIYIEFVRFPFTYTLSSILFMVCLQFQFQGIELSVLYAMLNSLSLLHFAANSSSRKYRNGFALVLLQCIYVCVVVVAGLMVHAVKLCVWFMNYIIMEFSLWNIFYALEMWFKTLNAIPCNSKVFTKLLHFKAEHMHEQHGCQQY